MNPILLAVSLLAIAVTDSEVAPLQLTLQLSSSSICQYDPLVCRVVLENRGETPLVLAKELSSSVGTLRFEIRAQDGVWRSVRIVGQGQVKSVGEPLSLEPDSALATYETAYGHERGYCFPDVGDFQLRAVASQKGWQLASTPVALTVTKLGEKDHSFRLEKFHKLISVVRFTGVASQTAMLKEANERLEASELKRHVQWQIELRALQQTSAEQRDAKFATVANLTREMPGISATPACALLARVCLAHRRPDLALKVLADADPDFGEVQVLRKACKP